MYLGDYYTCTRSKMIEYLGAVVLEDEIAELQRRRHAIIVCDDIYYIIIDLCNLEQQ